ncbi:LOW QUALITY PROTEIN: putative helicase mov-10-B.1 [Aphomia sociella]
MNCNVCGFVDETYNENAECEHNATAKHISNVILADFKMNKNSYTGNSGGIEVFSSVHNNDVSYLKNTDERIIKINVKLKQKVEFSFNITNDMENESVVLLGVLLPHPQPQFQILNPTVFGQEPFVLENKTSVKRKVAITFESEEIGNYEMPIIFTFYKEKENERKFIIIREMNYSMTAVQLIKNPEGSGYLLEVQGLAEKRPSVLRGDKILIRSSDNTQIVFESFVKNIMNSQILLTGFDEMFDEDYDEDTLFDVQFLMCRVPLERMHDAVSKLFTSEQVIRVFPEQTEEPVELKVIPRFYNNLIKDNEEQKSAVQHIVSGTSRRCPYVVFGPAGTGKTMTIVEAIVQLVVANPHNRILVCTNSNMAADHIASMLLQYRTKLKISNFIFRANSQSREWKVMPSALKPVSNGTGYRTFYSLSNFTAASYRVLVMTLSHTAKYALEENQSAHKLQMTHLFIDEAAQASEPATLIPICGLLASNGHLILAGDPKQLGPFCLSQVARSRGLGTSLMERLMKCYGNMYRNNSTYTMMKNFRSNPDILRIPNKLFYNNCLQPQINSDPLSEVSILGLPGGDRAVVFHAVQSQEKRMGKSPSYYNEIELSVLQRYTTALVDEHKVLEEDIGIITPYIRQVYKMRSWLEMNYSKVEVGTVEAFQGKEKRVILVSTVRANAKLLDYDAKYNLGFLVDEKRFNVALTRAKSKIIIIGNPECLTKDSKWRMYIDFCTNYETRHGTSTQHLPRDTDLPSETAYKSTPNRTIKRTTTPCRVEDAWSSQLGRRTHATNIRQATDNEQYAVPSTSIATKRDRKPTQPRRKSLRHSSALLYCTTASVIARMQYEAAERLVNIRRKQFKIDEELIIRANRSLEQTDITKDFKLLSTNDGN